MKLAAELSHYGLYALMIAMPLIGWAMLSAAAYPVTLWSASAAADPAAERNLHTLLWDAHLSGVRVFCADSVAFRGGAVSRADPAGRRFRGDGPAFDA